MTQSSPIEPYDEVVADYSQQARAFLSKSREYLDDGDLHQAAEKGWGAAAWMAKAVAEAHGWEYKKHDQFFEVMYRARDLSGDARLDDLRARANELHGFFYTRKRFLHPDVIERGLDQMEILLSILQPLTGAGR
jgi:hypothetical protein